MFGQGRLIDIFKKNYIKKVISGITVGSILFAFGSCGTGASGVADILTQKKTDGDRTQITVLVKHAFSINEFEKRVEEKFPDIDLVQVNNYTRDMGTAEYAARLEHDDLTDIVMTWPVDAGQDFVDDRLMDLSGMDFTSRYNLSALNDISSEGKLYYLPGPSQIRGIVYNKTLFEEKGWQVPADYDGFIKLCQTIEASGIRSLQLGLGNEEVLDTAFTGYSYGNCYSKSKDSDWIASYNQGNGSFGDHFGTALDTFQGMINAGIWKASDLDITYSQREKMLFTRQCAMVEDSVLLSRSGYAQTGTTDEYALMPFFSPEDGGDWARLYMVCYIGLNQHLADAQNKNKFDLVMKLMDYISTPDGQEALSADTGGMFSSLKGVQPPDVPEITPMLSALKQGRYAVFQPLENAQPALRKGLAGMLTGTYSKADVIRMVDEQNLAPPAEKTSEVLGAASKDFSMIETGNFITDAMRSYTGSDVALFLDDGKDGAHNAKGLSARLYGGDVTEADLDRILPDLKYEDTGLLCKVAMTGADLLQTLEHALPVENQNAGWFYYFSGLKLTFDPTAEPGQRVKKIALADGSALNPDTVYTVAVMDATVPEDYFQSNEATAITIKDLLMETLQQQKNISPSNDKRFRLV